MKITESAAELAVMTRAEAEAIVDQWIAEAPPMAPDKAAEFNHLLSVLEAGWRHGLGQVLLTATGRESLIASTIDPALAAMLWEEGLKRAGLASRLAEGEADDDEPYCYACGAPAGIFYGHGDGWHHYRGEGAAASPVELYDAGHAPEVAWRPAGSR